MTQDNFEAYKKNLKRRNIERYVPLDENMPFHLQDNRVVIDPNEYSHFEHHLEEYTKLYVYIYRKYGEEIKIIEERNKENTFIDNVIELFDKLKNTIDKHEFIVSIKYPLWEVEIQKYKGESNETK